MNNIKSVQAGVKTVVRIEERIPALDMIKVFDHLKHRPKRLIGPNCPDVISPGKIKVGTGIYI